jgi:hypothetical protein
VPLRKGRSLRKNAQTAREVVIWLAVVRVACAKILLCARGEDAAGCDLEGITHELAKG